MNIKEIWIMLIIALVSICTVSCGGDDDDDDLSQKSINNGSTTEILTDYTATASVKTATIKRNAYIGDYAFFEDYNNRYSIVIVGGRFIVSHEVRFDGRFTDSYTPIVSSHARECGIRDVGMVSNISDIIFKDFSDPEGMDNSKCLRYSSVFQPNHGYAVIFTTEKGEQKYMRVYAKDYSLDSRGELESVTIQYQLY